MMASKKKLVALAILLASLLIALYMLLPNEGSNSCESYSLDKCPSRCVVCPPCEVCSSL